MNKQKKEKYILTCTLCGKKVSYLRKNLTFKCKCGGLLLLKAIKTTT